MAIGHAARAAANWLSGQRWEGVPWRPPTKAGREVAPKRTIKAEPEDAAASPQHSHAPATNPPGAPLLQLTFKVEVGPAAQENAGCPRQPQLGHLQQGVAHTFLVKWGVGLSLQQLSENEDAALLAGDIAGPGVGEGQTG